MFSRNPEASSLRKWLIGTWLGFDVGCSDEKKRDDENEGGKRTK